MQFNDLSCKAMTYTFNPGIDPNQMIKDNEEAIGWKNLNKNEEKDNKLNSSRDTLTNT